MLHFVRLLVILTCMLEPAGCEAMQLIITGEYKQYIAVTLYL